MNKRILFYSYAAVLTGTAALTMAIYAFAPDLYHFTWLFSFLFTAAMYAAGFFLYSRALKDDPQKRTLLFLAITTLKMLMAMIYILVLVFRFAECDLRDYLYFMSLYLIFLITEVIVFTALLREKHPGNSEKMS